MATTAKRRTKAGPIGQGLRTVAKAGSTLDRVVGGPVKGVYETTKRMGAMVDRELGRVIRNPQRPSGSGTQGYHLWLGNRKKHYATFEGAHGAGVEAARDGVHSGFEVEDLGRGGERVEYLRDGRRATAVVANKKRKSNPESSAAAMHEKFLGKPSEEILEYIEKEHYHSNLAGLAPLIGLKVRTVSGLDATLEFTDVVLGSNEDGTHLYLIGGDQKPDLRTLEIEENDKDSIVIGEVWAIAYHASKSFDEFQPTDYVHVLGDEKNHTKLARGADLWDDAEPPKDRAFGTGELPTLRYDVMNQRLFLDGGIYKIHKPLIGVSDGIID